MKRASLVVFLALVWACHHHPPTSIAAADSDRIAQDAARLAELRKKLDAGNLSCDDTCKLATEGCEITRSTCALAERNRDQEDFQQRCASANDDCASFNSACAHCAADAGAR